MRRIGKGLSAFVLAAIFMLSCAVLVFADTAYISTSDGGSVNMRAEASTDSDVVNFLADGTEVEVLGTEGDWTQVSYDGYTGYVMSTYLTTESAAAETTDTSTEEAADTTAEEAADTSADTAADTTSEAADTTADTTADTVTDTSSTDTVDTEEEVTSDDDSTSVLTEKLAKYKKMVMILALACLILVIIIINLLLFYRRGYDDDEYDEDYDDEDEDDEEDEDDDRHTSGRRRRQQYEPEEQPSVQKQPVKRDVEVPDISKLVDDTAAEAYSETAGVPQRGADTAADTSGSSDELEFLDLDDL